MGSFDMVDEQSRDCWLDLDDLTVTRVQRLLSSSEQMNKMTEALMLINNEDWEVCCSSIDEKFEQMISSIDQQQNRLKRHMMLMWTMSLNCKCKLELHLRLGYLKPFLAESKKTRQGPGCKVVALCISRCWFYLTVVAIPKLMQKDYKIIWCCVLLCYGSWWLKWYVNDEV